MHDDPKILVVDDDEAIRETLREVLEPEGFDVSVAENGSVGLEAMRSDHPDVVLLDLMMPVMSGWEVLEEADSDARLRELPIIVLSAMCAPLADHGRVGGVQQCFCKPVDLTALIETLRSLTTSVRGRKLPRRATTPPP